MDKIILPRRSGKTSKLIEISEKTGTYILVADASRQREVANMAREQGKNIPFPVTLSDYLNTRFRGSFIKHILIDDADDVLRRLFEGIHIDTVTITDPSPDREYIDGLAAGRIVGSMGRTTGEDKTMLFIIDKKKYDTKKMEEIATVKKWYAVDDAITQLMYPGKEVGRYFTCTLWKSEKGNWLLTREYNYTTYGEAILEDEAKNLLMRYATEKYEEMYEPLPEA